MFVGEASTGAEPTDVPVEVEMYDSEKYKAYYYANLEKMKLKHKIRYAKNSESLKEYQKRYRKDNPEKIKELFKKWKEENRDHLREYNKKYFKKYNKTERGKEVLRRAWKKQRVVNYDKILARKRLNYAVEYGHINKQPCEKCGEKKSEGHHKDYSKPLEVVWLCSKHHRELHRRG